MKISLALKKTDFIFILLSFVLCSFQVVNSQDCQFMVTSSWKKTSFPESECPCFHSDSDIKNESCLGKIFCFARVVSIGYFRAFYFVFVPL